MSTLHKVLIAVTCPGHDAAWPDRNRRGAAQLFNLGACPAKDCWRILVVVKAAGEAPAPRPAITIRHHAHHQASPPGKGIDGV